MYFVLNLSLLQSCLASCIWAPRAIVLNEYRGEHRRVCKLGPVSFHLLVLEIPVPLFIRVEVALTLA